MKSSNKEHTYIEILRLPPNKKRDALTSLPSIRGEPLTHLDMTKIEFLDKFKQYFEREFDINETLHLIQHTNRNVYWSWGVDNIHHFPNKGLLIRVNGHHHTGYVLITLAWNDTYTYRLFNDDFTVKKEVTEVYFDELQHRIDLDIEYISLYNN